MACSGISSLASVVGVNPRGAFAGFSVIFKETQEGQTKSVALENIKQVLSQEMFK